MLHANLLCKLCRRQMCSLRKWRAVPPEEGECPRLHLDHKLAALPPRNHQSSSRHRLRKILIFETGRGLGTIDVGSIWWCDLTQAWLCALIVCIFVPSLDPRGSVTTRSVPKFYHPFAFAFEICSTRRTLRGLTRDHSWARCTSHLRYLPLWCKYYRNPGDMRRKKRESMPASDDKRPPSSVLQCIFSRNMKSS